VAFARGGVRQSACRVEIRVIRMSSIFWTRLHGGATHFPIAFIFGAALFDALGFFCSSRQREFQTTGYWLLILGGVGSFGAMFSGLVTSKWNACGQGLLLQHHLFVWPAFALIVGLTTWRVAVGASPSGRAFGIYFSVLTIACALVGAAGYTGGELLLGR
jgi:uncharacterized membrane protein